MECIALKQISNFGELAAAEAPVVEFPCGRLTKSVYSAVHSDVARLARWSETTLDALVSAVRSGEKVHRLEQAQLQIMGFANADGIPYEHYALVIKECVTGPTCSEVGECGKLELTALTAIRAPWPDD